MGSCPPRPGSRRVPWSPCSRWGSPAPLYPFYWGLLKHFVWSLNHIALGDPTENTAPRITSSSSFITISWHFTHRGLQGLWTKVLLDRLNTRPRGHVGSPRRSWTALPVRRWPETPCIPAAPATRPRISSRKWVDTNLLKVIFPSSGWNT